MNFDNRQLILLQDLAIFFKPTFSLARLFKKKPSAIYVYGPVGRGKTTVIRHFLSTLDCKILYFHHEKFMLMVYESLSLMHIDEFITKIQRECDFIWIDEVQFRDMSETLLLIKILKILIKNKIKVILSGNPSPHDLFENVHIYPEAQKSLAFFKKTFYCLNLDGGKDYRNKKNNDPQAKRFFFKAEFENFKKQFHQMANKKPIVPKELKFSKRQWVLEKTYGTTAWLSFDDAIVCSRSATDYQALTDYFDVLFLSILPVLTNNNHEEVKKIMVLVDLIYEKNKQLFLCAEALPNKIYQAEKSALRPFERTSSRLTQLCCVGDGLQPDNSNSK